MTDLFASVQTSNSIEEERIELLFGPNGMQAGTGREQEHKF